MNSNHEMVIQRALAVMQRRGQPIGQTAEIKRICAVHGAAYSAVYREINGVWRHEECVRPTAARGAGDSGRSISIDWASVEDGTDEICPWCGCGPKTLGGTRALFVQCSRCNNHVCLGRSDGDTFRCYAACGLVGRISGSINTSTATLRLASAFGLTVTGSRRAIGGSTPLLLTSGKQR